MRAQGETNTGGTWREGQDVMLPPSSRTGVLPDVAGARQVSNCGNAAATDGTWTWSKEDSYSTALANCCCNKSVGEELPESGMLCEIPWLNVGLVLQPLCSSQKRLDLLLTCNLRPGSWQLKNKAARLQMRGAGGKEKGMPGREQCLWSRQLQTEVRQEPHFVGRCSERSKGPLNESLNLSKAITSKELVCRARRQS